MKLSTKPVELSFLPSYDDKIQDISYEEFQEYLSKRRTPSPRRPKSRPKRVPIEKKGDYKPLTPSEYLKTPQKAQDSLTTEFQPPIYREATPKKEHMRATRVYKQKKVEPSTPNRELIVIHNFGPDDTPPVAYFGSFDPKTNRIKKYVQYHNPSLKLSLSEDCKK